MARQGLLELGDARPAEMVERLVGMQAQVPENPYVGLFSRLEEFDPRELSQLIADRSLARAPTLRTTVHLLSRSDCLALQPLTASLRARTFRSPWATGLAGADVDEVVAAGLELIAMDGPRTRAQLGAWLAARWPDADRLALSHAVTFNAPLVQVPPRGLWGESGQATWAHAPDWLEAPLALAAGPDEYVLRYLRAFGPATPSDIRTWCGITGLRAVIDRLRPGLRTFAAEDGRELLDVPDGLLPDSETPAPPRFLPEYDNVALSHADRSRLFDGRGPGAPFFTGKWVGVLLVDGFYRANWQLVDGVVTVDRFAPSSDDPPGSVAAIEAEALRLAAFVAPGVDATVRFTPAC